MNADLRDRMAKHLAISDGLAWFLLADAEVEKYRRYSETAVRGALEWAEEKAKSLGIPGEGKVVHSVDFACWLKEEAGL